MTQLPTGPPTTPRPALEASSRRRQNLDTAAASSSGSTWQERARTPVWRTETNPLVNKAQLAKLGTGPELWLSHDAPPAAMLPPVDHAEIAKEGPFLEFFLQRPFQQKAVNDAIPHARKADAIHRARRDAAQLKLETERLNDSLRFLESIGLSPRRPRRPKNDPLLFLTGSDEDETDDESSRRMSIRGELTKGQRPSTAGSARSGLLSRPSSSGSYLRG